MRGVTVGTREYGRYAGSDAICPFALKLEEPT